MPESLEARVAELEKQVAELMKMKRRLDNADIEKELRAAEGATDALLVERENEFIPKGLYCRNCWSTRHRLTALDLGPNRIPGYDRDPLRHCCPGCGKVLSIQFPNRHS